MPDETIDPQLLCVVDDDAGTARMEQLELQRRGYEVLACASTEEALAHPRLADVQCWLIDQQLTGGRTGLELVAALQERGMQAPCVLVTGNEDPDVVLQALRAGVRDFVHKGDSFLEMLVSCVERVLQSTRAAHELQRTKARAAVEAERRRELEREIGERRSAEQRAQKALEKLQEIDRRKDEFLAMLGHELRNPLAPISNAVEVLRTAPDPEHVRRVSEIIARQVDQMRHLVDDLLDVARIMNGKLPMRREVVDIRTVVDQAVERIQPSFTQNQHQVRVDTGRDAALVEGDAVRLVQIVSNLLDNATKYTQPGGHIEVEVGTTPTSVTLLVRDDGAGIAADQIDALFDLFVQGERSPERAEGGLGLGLTLVRRLVTMHGGEVEASSPGPGAGSTFSVRLPRTQAASAADDAAARPDTQAAHTPVALIVDDNVDSATSAGMLLELWGFRTVLAHDGEAALRCLEQHDPDAVLLDIGLPKLDGYEVIRAAKQPSTERKRLWLAVTGYGQQSDREQALAAGFDEHLTKPVQPETLRAALAPLLSDQ